MIRHRQSGHSYSSINESQKCGHLLGTHVNKTNLKKTIVSLFSDNSKWNDVIRQQCKSIIVNVKVISVLVFGENWVFQRLE